MDATKTLFDRLDAESKNSKLTLATKTLINRIDAELINSKWTLESLNLDVGDLNTKIYAGCNIKPKTLFAPERLDGPIVGLINNLKMSVPNGISIELVEIERKMIYRRQEAIVRIHVTLSQEYITERYNDLFSVDFQNTLLNNRKNEINEIIRLNPNPIHNHRMIIYNDGMYQPIDDYDDPMIRFSDLGLKNLENKTQIYTLAKTILDLLNNGTDRYEINAPVVRDFRDDLRWDFHLYIQENHQSQSTVNKNDLQDW